MQRQLTLLILEEGRLTIIVEATNAEAINTVDPGGQINDHHRGDQCRGD